MMMHRIEPISATAISATALGRLAFLTLCVMRVETADSQALDEILDGLNSVHPFSEVALSPDGKLLVYGSVVKGTRGGADVDVSALWLVDAKDGSAPVRLTACPRSICDEHGAAWSADGKQIVFVTTGVDEQAQIVSADAAGAHVTTLTQAHGPVDTPRFSPDGTRIAFLYSEGAPKQPGPLNPLDRDAGVLSSTIYEQRLAVVPARGGPTAVLGPADLNIYEYDWSPDSTKFVVTAAQGSGDNNWWLAELAVMDAGSGLMSDETITGGDLYVIGRDGGTPIDATPGLAASVQTFTWNGSASRVIANEFAAGDEVLVAIDVDRKSQHDLWRGPQMIWASNIIGLAPGDTGISLSRDGRFSAVIRQSVTDPPEVETGPPGKWRPITHANAHVRPLTGAATNVRWRSAPYEVQGILIAPPKVEPGRRYPMVVDVHGGPAYAHYPMFPTISDPFDAALASRGYYVFQPNPRGSYGQGEAFTQANIKDFGGGDLRDVLAGLDAVVKSAPIDAERVGITGWSYGGYMTMWALTQTQRFKAAVAGAGLSDWLSYYGTNDIDTWMLPYFGASVYDNPKIYERSSPMTFIKNVRTPTLLLGGDRDAEVPITQSYEYWNALRRLGVTTEFVVYPDEGHVFFKRADQLDAMSRLVDWFDDHMQPGAAAVQ